MRKGSLGKGLKTIEEVIQRLGGGFEVAFGPELGNAGGAELDSFWVQRFVQAVGRE